MHADINVLADELIGAALESRDADVWNVAEAIATACDSDVDTLTFIARRYTREDPRATLSIPDPLHRESLYDFVSAVVGRSGSDSGEIARRLLESSEMRELLITLAEACVEVEALGTWSCADDHTTNAPLFLALRRMMLASGIPATEASSLSAQLDAAGEEVTARALISAAKQQWERDAR